METIIFTGLQATGKSTFYKKYFYETHIRINLDMLKTRHRENILLKACLEAKQAFVVDNTNPTIEVRKKYIDAAKQAGFRVFGYYFRSHLKEAIDRNNRRSSKACIPEKGLRATYAKLQIPSFSEGFDALYYVVQKEGSFLVKEWRIENDVPVPE